MLWFKTNRVKLLTTLLLAAVAATMLLPFLWMLSTSVKKQIDVFHDPMIWIPASMQWNNYKEIWFGSHPFALYYLNSIKVTALSVIGVVVISSATAYGFARFQFKGKNFVFLIFLATMMVPDQVTLIPRFILFNYLGIYNTHWALILPGIFTAIGIFLLRQTYLTIPGDFSEAAKIEGANHFHIWTRIFIPLSKPAMVSLIILSFTWNWNEFVNPLVFLTSKKLFTVPLGLTNFVDDSGTNYPQMMAAAVSSILPVIALFLIGQRWFIQGVASSGIKG
ncbi:carbohydrate ABC transporter permease [Paenibacillus piri]|uniref:Carbohydrate ABC transporter permease n=1 Tax=Paenibacillus piri TaxID=2547395 RepID=A0A4R5K7M3_9BACL|nr:carbohydrate ABC transporter permease [Paenibacillus piri]TDF90531.1 carbohydrate ABC transporter permease [Paenibacillus piri]